MCLILKHSSLHKWRNSFRPYEDIKIHDILFSSHNSPHITLGNEQCLIFWLGVCNTKKRGDIRDILVGIRIWTLGTEPKFLCLFFFEDTFTSFFKDKKSQRSGTLQKTTRKSPYTYPPLHFSLQLVRGFELTYLTFPDRLASTSHEQIVHFLKCKFPLHVQPPAQRERKKTYTQAIYLRPVLWIRIRIILVTWIHIRIRIRIK